MLTSRDAKVRAFADATITKGSVVWVSNQQGSRKRVSLASAGSASTGGASVLMVAASDAGAGDPIAVSSSMTVTRENVVTRELEQIPELSGGLRGDPVYLSDTPGEISLAPGTLGRAIGHVINDFAWEFSSSAGLQGDGGYAGFEDYNDTSTAAGLAILADAWTSVPNDGQGAFTNKDYSPGVGDLIDSSGRLVLSGLNLGDTVLIRNDIRVTPSISGAFLEWRYQLGTGAGTYYLTQPLGLLGDGAREYAFQFLQLIYIGDENTRQNLCVPQVRCTEDTTFQNLGAVVTVLKLGA